MSELSGSQLKYIREERQIPLEQVSSATRIRLSLLEALEADEYAELGSRTQARGFLKIYADFLGISMDAPAEAPIPVLPTKAALKTDSSAELPQSSQGKAPKNDSQPAEPRKTKKSKPPILPRLKKQVRIIPDELAPLTAASTRSQQILDEIGRDLQARRKYLDVPWEVLVEHTHIPRKQLVALEQGQLETFASLSEAKGLLQTYARFLNLDTDMLMIRFADALQERRLEKAQPDANKRKTARRLPPFVLALRRFFTLDLFFGTILVGGILIFLLWGAADLINRPNASADSTPLPEMMDVIIGSQTPVEIMPTMTPVVTEQAVLLPSPTPLILPTDSTASVQVVIQARQTVWVRVSADGEEVFRGRMLAGSASAYSADEYLEVEAGNIAALSFVFNGSALEPINRVGEVGRLRFDPTGMTDLSSMPSYLLTPSPTPKP